MIKCDHLLKRFSEKTVLDHVSFEIPEGEIFGFLGPSGAGKTTLIRILTGQLSFEGGLVFVFDKPVNDLTQNDKKRIGIMMDSFGIYERFSCADNLKIFAEIYDIQHTRIPVVLKRVGLEDVGHKPASNLSKGMRTRLSLARCLLHAPRLIFFDEPTSGLDPQTMNKIHRIIMDLKRDGCTVFLTTHNMEEAHTLCDTVALLHEGVIAEIGPPDVICRKYNHQKKIRLHLSTGEDVELPQDKTAAQTISNLLASGITESIHSSEPTLESVFLELTGHTLQEDE